MKIFITGAAGYVGGSVAQRLLGEGHIIFGLVRSEEQAAVIARRKIEPVMGNLTDYNSLKRAIAAADAVINCADSDNILFVTTALEALRNSGKTLIHTSGSSIVGDKSAGEYSGRVHHEDFISPLPEKAARVAIDRTVMGAAAIGVRSIVICPTMIYGEGLGAKRDSIQVPLLARTAKETGGAKHIGKGENVWSNVHIEDLVDLYALALKQALPGSFFFAENGEASLRQIARSINKGLGIDAEPRAISIDEGIGYWGAEAAHFALGANSRVTSRKARALLGWNPRKNAILEEIERGFGYHR